MTATVKTVPEMLREAANIFEDRAVLYGDNYKYFGYVMQGMFPRGITLTTPEDHTRFALLVHMMTKNTRYAQQFAKGGHDDSLIDNANYTSMLREVDFDIKEAAARKERAMTESLKSLDESFDSTSNLTGKTGDIVSGEASYYEEPKPRKPRMRADVFDDEPLPSFLTKRTEVNE